MLELFFGLMFLELLLYSSLIWRAHRLIAVLLTATSLPVAFMITLADFNVLTVLLLIICIHRVFNFCRILAARSKQESTYRRSRRTSFNLVFMSVALLVMLRFNLFDNLDLPWLSVAIYLQFAAAITIFSVTIRNILKSRHNPNKEHYTDHDLPTVTVAIPARNEAEGIADCIRNILASDYPKLEIIVLDDCSHDHTAEVIRGFANQGVRFIKGEVPHDRWLAKNQAYEKLRIESLGQYIVFCDVDSRLNPESIRQLISTMLYRKKVMLSVLPKRLSGSPSSVFIQPMRYWWELALPRRYFNRPPVINACWAIQKRFLDKLGGFKAVSRTILPEAYFAREAIKSDGYSFLRARENMEVQSIKNLSSQKESAVRMRYPQLRRRPEMVLLLTMAEFFFLLGPFLLSAASLFMVISGHLILVYLSCLLLVMTHIIIVWISNPLSLPVALLNYPIVVITEIILAYESMYKYEFSEVEWKGRNVCVPVMEVIPHLPKLHG